MAGELTCRGDVCADIDVHAGELVADLAGAEGPPAHLPRPVPLRQYLLVRLREAIQKKKLIFSDFVRKREGGSRTKPTFLHKDNLGSNFKGLGAKLLFPKSKFHLVWFLGLYPNFILSQSHMFCSGTGD